MSVGHWIGGIAEQRTTEAADRFRMIPSPRLGCKLRGPRERGLGNCLGRCERQAARERAPIAKFAVRSTLSGHAAQERGPDEPSLARALSLPLLESDEVLTGRVLHARPEPAAEEAVAAALDRYSSPKSPIHPGTSASPEAAVAAAEEAVAAVAAEPRRRNCRSGWQGSCSIRTCCCS